VTAACGIVSIFLACATLTDSAGDITQMANLARGEYENNVKRANFDTLANYSLLPPNVPNNSSLACYVQNHPTITDVREVILVPSFRGKSNRVVGEDQNLNGVLDGGEDTDGNGRLSSIYEIVTYVMR